MTGLNILVVEDDPLMGATLLDALGDAGYTVIGPASTLAEALDLARVQHFRVAVLDYDLHGEPVIPLAWSLCRRRIPIVIFSGLDATVIEKTLPDTCISISKSRGIPALVRAVQRVAEMPV